MAPRNGDIVVFPMHVDQCIRFEPTCRTAGNVSDPVTSCVVPATSSMVNSILFHQLRLQLASPPTITSLLRASDDPPSPQPITSSPTNHPASTASSSAPRSSSQSSTFLAPTTSLPLSAHELARFCRASGSRWLHSSCHQPATCERCSRITGAHDVLARCTSLAPLLPVWTMDGGRYGYRYGLPSLQVIAEAPNPSRYHFARGSRTESQKYTDARPPFSPACVLGRC